MNSPTVFQYFLYASRTTLVTGLYILCTRKSGCHNFVYTCSGHIYVLGLYIYRTSCMYIYIYNIERDIMVVGVADFLAKYQGTKCSRSWNHYQRLYPKGVCTTPTSSKYRRNKVSFKIVESCDREDVLSNSSHVLDGLLNCNRPARLSISGYRILSLPIMAFLFIKRNLNIYLMSL